MGNYTWTATTQIGSKRLEKSGRFSVQPVMLETANLVADHDMLKSLSKATGGKFFTKDNIQKIAQEIKNNENIKPIATYQKKYTMLLNSPWYLIAIVLLLGAEWFLRKWNGDIRDEGMKKIVTRHSHRKITFTTARIGGGTSRLMKEMRRLPF